jgi:hypothetical protein
MDDAVHAAALFRLKYQLAHHGDEGGAHAVEVCARELLARFGLESIEFDRSSARAWRSARGRRFAKRIKVQALAGRGGRACTGGSQNVANPAPRWRDQWLLPGASGVIDVAGFLQALDHIGYDGPVAAGPFNAGLNAMPPADRVRLTRQSLANIWAQAGLHSPSA